MANKIFDLKKILNFFYKVNTDHNLIYFTDIVAEVTQPSLGVGYEIGRAIGESYDSFDHKRALVKYQSQSELIEVMF